MAEHSPRLVEAHIRSVDVLLFADHALGDVRRWWTDTGRHMLDSPPFEAVFEFVLAVSSEAQASWSMLIDAGGGHRTYTVGMGLVPIVVQLTELGDDLVVTGFKFPPPTG